MQYIVGKPYIFAAWIYWPNTYFQVHYWSQVSMLEDGPTDSEWIVPGTLSD